MSDDERARGEDDAVRGARAGLGRGAARRGRPRRARRRCATRPPTSWPRRCWTCSRARSSGIGPAIDGRLLLRLRAAPAADARRPRRRSRRGCASRRGRPSVRPQGVAPDEGRAVLVERGQPYKVEILDDLAARGRARRRRRCRRSTSTSTARSSTCAAGRTSRPRARSGRSSCSASAGAYWRGDEKRPMLQRDLRHGLGDPGGARRLPVAPRGGEEARSPPARRPARPVQLPRRLARARRSGIPRASACGGRSRGRCASSRSGAATRRSRRRSWSTSGCGSSRATGTTTARTCSRRVEEQTFSLKPMNCPECTFIYRAACARTATCRCATPSTAGSIATSGRGVAAAA